MTVVAGAAVAKRKRHVPTKCRPLWSCSRRRTFAAENSEEVDLNPSSSRELAVAVAFAVGTACAAVDGRADEDSAEDDTVLHKRLHEWGHHLRRLRVVGFPCSFLLARSASTIATVTLDLISIDRTGSLCVSLVNGAFQQPLSTKRFKVDSMLRCSLCLKMTRLLAKTTRCSMR